MAQLVVEVRDSHRRLQGIYPVESLPVSIGRGYDNDIILVDPYVSARHLRVDAAEQGWLASDLGSLNSETVATDQQAETHLNSGDEMVIGKTHLHFFSPHHPVAEAKSLHEKTSIIEVSRTLLAVWSLLIILVLGFALNDYMRLSMEVQFDKLVAGTLPVVAGVLTWAGGWTLLAYIVRRRLYFYYFLAVSVLYVLADITLEIIVGILAFNITSNWMAEALSYFTGGILLVGLFYASMHQAFAMSRRRKLVLANIFSWGLVAVVVFVVYANRPEFDHNPEFPAELKPPFTRFAPLEKFDVFIDNTENMLNDF